MLLKNKNAILYGAGGSVGEVVARVFASEGARVFLTGRHTGKIRTIAQSIEDSGGQAEFAKVDALSRTEVDNYLQRLSERGYPIHISFNLIGVEDVQGSSLMDMAVEDVLLPVKKAVASQLITSTAAAREMMKSGGGSILLLSANAAKKPYRNTGGFGIACAAMEALSRQLALELGPHGIRVNCLRSAGSPDAAGVSEVFDQHAQLQGISREDFEKGFAERTMLGRLPRLEEVANAAALVASQKASAVTSAIINLTCGELSD